MRSGNINNATVSAEDAAEREDDIVVDQNPEFATLDSELAAGSASLKQAVDPWIYLAIVLMSPLSHHWHTILEQCRQEFYAHSRGRGTRLIHGWNTQTVCRQYEPFVKSAQSAPFPGLSTLADPMYLRLC